MRVRSFQCASFILFLFLFYTLLSLLSLLASSFLLLRRLLRGEGRTNVHTQGAKTWCPALTDLVAFFLHTNNRGCASPPCMLFALLLLCTDFAACDSLLLSSSLTARRPSFCYITILPSLPPFPPSSRRRKKLWRL